MGMEWNISPKIEICISNVGYCLCVVLYVVLFY